MNVCEEKQIKLPGFTLAIKIWHKKTGKPVLCLHGKMDNAASFDLLAPYLPELQLVAVDSPGNGLSSTYQEGVIPYWKTDAFLLLHLIKEFQWEKFDIIAHSLGGLLASTIAIALPKQVRKLIFLDILGPTVNFTERSLAYLHHAVTTYMTYSQHERSLFPTQESAIQKRMKTGNISHQAAQALVQRGTKKTAEGLVWTFDPRLRCVGSTLPFEDEVRTMLKELEMPVCLVRAKQGVSYPEKIFQERAASIKNLTIHEVEGGHHVHMDNPEPVAKIISQFLSD